MKNTVKIRTMIRQIVREEVAMAIQEVITELKQPTKQVSKPAMKEKKKIVEDTVYKKYTDNSVLNDILNETASEGEWKTLGGKTQTTENMSDIMNKSYSNLMNPQQAVVPDIATSMGVDPSDPAMSFLKKDYSKVVKAMETKANQSRGG